jgi:hypothetical protein
VVAWSTAAWLASVVAVIASGVVAAREDLWRKRPGLDMGFANHGGMWGDLLLLPIVNGLIVPWIAPGWWLAGPLVLGTVVSCALHAWWHGGRRDDVRDHIWPSRRSGRWRGDLSGAGWCHVVFVAGEATLLLAYLPTPVPAAVVVTVSTIMSLHVPLGVLQPAWYGTGRVLAASGRLVAVAVGTAWAVAAAKL